MLHLETSCHFLFRAGKRMNLSFSPTYIIARAESEETKVGAGEAASRLLADDCSPSEAALLISSHRGSRAHIGQCHYVRQASRTAFLHSGNKTDSPHPR